jgi:hypothetical protein
MKKQRQVPDFGFKDTTYVKVYSFPCEPEIWDNSWTLDEPWLNERVYGTAGSAQMLAEQVKHALISPILIPLLTRLSWLDGPMRQEIEHNYELAICLLRKGDSKFYRMVADGLEAQEKLDPLKSDDPRIFMCLAYRYYENQNSGNLPTKNEVVAMAKRIWALVRVRGSIKEALGLLSGPLGPALEKQIDVKIKALPQVKWSRAFKVLEQKLPSAKPGPKKRSPLINALKDAA